MKAGLSEKWIKASITGTIWAASEIVLGSFLHNLKIPFSGNILTAIGIIILVSVSHIWTEKGLIWRAGLICALMKTMSPSAVIFGPMIAIFSEALVLEFFIRFFGRTLAAYLIGSMMAMSWNLFQKIANYILFYGMNIIEVYADLLKMAQKQLNIQTDIIWLPIIILLVIYSLFGLFAAVTGIKVGRKLIEQPAPIQPETTYNTFSDFVKTPSKDFEYSIKWLLINIFLIIGSFVILNYTEWMIWSPTITIIILIWSVRYKRALRQLSKPKFWFFFVLITLLTAFVFSKAQSGKDMLTEGLLTGFQMNFRAAIIIVGFSVLGTELYNPRIRNFFLRTSFNHLPLALELSAESLPSVIAGIPDFKTLIRNPVSIFYQIISNAERRLAEIKNKPPFNQKVFIISGEKGEGKTTFTRNLAHFLIKNNVAVGGILSGRIMNGPETIGYDISDIETNEKKRLLRINNEHIKERIGNFSIHPEGIRRGKSILNGAILNQKKILIIDETGRLELNNNGWSEPIDNIIKTPTSHLLLSVRENLVDEVILKWNFKDPVIFKVAASDFETAGKMIMKLIRDE